jgi:hypothetical protein
MVRLAAVAAALVASTVGFVASQQLGSSPTPQFPITTSIAPDGKTVSVSWDPQPNVHEYVFTLDGDEHLADGKRHFTFDASRTSATFGLPQDGQPHEPGVEKLELTATGAIASPVPTTTAATTTAPTSTTVPTTTAPAPTTTVSMTTEPVPTTTVATTTSPAGPILGATAQSWDLAGGNLSQWNGVQHCPTAGSSCAGSTGAPTSVTVVPAPTGMPGQFAAQLKTDGDAVQTGHSPAKVRAQLNSTAAQAGTVAGQTWWYEFFLRFPSALNGPLNGAWKSWHIVQQSGTGQAFNAPHINAQDFADGNGPILQLETYTGTSTAPKGDIHATLAPLQYDRTYRIDELITWSPSKASGHIKAFVDGALVVDQAAQTMPQDGVAQQFNLDMYRLQAQPAPCPCDTTVVIGGVRRAAP